MKYLVFSLLISFGGVYTDICDKSPLETCQEVLYSNNIFSVGGYPTVEQLKSHCPSIISYLNCVEEYKNHCDFDELGIFSTEAQFIKVQDFIQEICNPDSKLHRKYVENVECLVSLNQNMTDCTQGAIQMYHDYAAFKKSHIPERDEPYLGNNVLCVSKSYSVICVVMKALTHCGAEAYNLSLELINRSNLLQNFCRRMELYDLQTSFIDFLDIEDEKKELLISLFKP